MSTVLVIWDAELRGWDEELKWWLSVESICCSYKGPEFVPSNHVKWITTTTTGNSFSRDLIFWPSKVNTRYPKHAQAHTSINATPPKKGKEEKSKRMGWTHKFKITLKNTKMLCVCVCVSEKNVKKSSKVIYTHDPRIQKENEFRSSFWYVRPNLKQPNKIMTHRVKFLELLCLDRKSQNVSVWLN